MAYLKCKEVNQLIQSIPYHHRYLRIQGEKATLLLVSNDTPYSFYRDLREEGEKGKALNNAAVPAERLVTKTIGGSQQYLTSGKIT